MNAEVTVRFRVSNIISEEALEESGMTFDALVRWLIHEEGNILSIADSDGEIISVEEVE